MAIPTGILMNTIFHNNNNQSRIAFDIYVDSVNGNDSNDGLSPSTPKLTLNGAESLVTEDDMSVGLARGSSFDADEIVVTDNGITVGAYTPPQTGASDLPRVYGRTKLTGFTKTVGRTNVYQADVDLSTYPWTGSTDTFFSAFESDSAGSEMDPSDDPLIEVNDLATCDSTAGSFYVDVGVGGANIDTSGVNTVYIHTTNSDDAGSNGLVYSATIIEEPLKGFTHMSDLYADNFGADDGIRAVTFDNVEYANGVRHNFYLDTKVGYLTARMDNCISRNCRSRVGLDNPVNSSGHVIFFQGSALTVEAYVDNVQIFQDAALDAQLDNSVCGGFGSHSSGGATLQAYSITNCYGENFGTDFVAFGDVPGKVVLADNKMIECKNGALISQVSGDISVLRNFATGTTLAFGMERFVSGVPAGSYVLIAGNVVLPYRASGGTFYANSGATYDIFNNTVQCINNTVSNNIAVINASSSAVCDIRNNIFDGDNDEASSTSWGIAWPILINGTLPFSSNENLFYRFKSNAFAGLQYDGNNYQTISAWNTATGEDADSIIGDPDWETHPSTWTDIADAVPLSSDAIALQAGASFY